MSDTSSMSFPEAARRLGVPVRTLRQAIRAGKIPAPPQVSATASLPATWLASVQASTATFSWAQKSKVPAFARYEGTSAWRKYRNRVHEYARFKARAAG